MDILLFTPSYVPFRWGLSSNNTVPVYCFLLAASNSWDITLISWSVVECSLRMKSAITGEMRACSSLSNTFEVTGNPTERHETPSALRRIRSHDAPLLGASATLITTLAGLRAESFQEIIGFVRPLFISGNILHFLWQHTSGWKITSHHSYI